MSETIRERIERTERPGLAALLEAAQSGQGVKSADGASSAPKKRRINAGYIGFGIAPRINAAGRMADAGIAAAYLSLAAAEKGLDTCIIGSADEEGVKALLGVAPERRVHLIVAVGYGKEAPSLKKDRLPYDELVTVCR